MLTDKGKFVFGRMTDKGKPVFANLTDTGRFVFATTFIDSVPIITLISFTKSIISDEVGMTTSTVTFRSDIDLLGWEARADGLGIGQGLLVGNGSSVASGSDVTFDIDCTELTLGDKIYRINIYGKNRSGVWSTYE